MGVGVRGAWLMVQGSGLKVSRLKVKGQGHRAKGLWISVLGLRSRV